MNRSATQGPTALCPAPSRRPRPHSRTMIAAIALAMSAIAGCGTATMSTSWSPTSTPIPAACSQHTPATIPAERWNAAGAQLAPPGASAIRLCRYSGLNAHPRLILVGSRLLDSQTLVRRLVSEFDRLPSLHGAVACPNDDGSQILALLAYPDSRLVSISVGLGGCQLVTNGSVHRTASGFGYPPAFGPRLLEELKQLLIRHPRSQPGSARALARGHWSKLARSPLGIRYGPTFVWDGHELLELGGTTGGRLGGAPSISGAAYNPTDHRWRRVADAPPGLQPADGASVWTGHQVFIFGRPSGPNLAAHDVAGLYDPATNHWTVTSKAPVGPFISTPTAVWTGARVILAGTTRANKLELASYDPATNAWAALQPPISPQHPPLAVAILATNDGVLLWSLWGHATQTGPNTYTGKAGVDVFRLDRSETWRNVTGGWPQGHTVDDPIFTGSEILVAPGQIWCGLCSHPAPINEHGYQVDPKTLRITSLPHGPLDDLGPQIIWTGRAEISYNPSGEISGPHVHVLPGDIAILNLQTRKWNRGPRAPLQASDAPAVWDGTQLYVLAHNGTLMTYGH